WRCRGRTPAFSNALNVSIQVSYVSSYLVHPYFRAFEILPIVGQALPTAQSKNPQVPQSNASGFPPYFRHMLSQTSFLSLAQSPMRNSFSICLPSPLADQSSTSGICLKSAQHAQKIMISRRTSSPKYFPIFGKK